MHRIFLCVLALGCTVSVARAQQTAVDLTLTRHQSADLGEVLSRAPGLNVRRQGALGSEFTLSLDRMTGQAVPVFIDDVPLELAGYSQGVADLPLFTLSRVDVHRGAVPIRLGADALGGALNVRRALPLRPYAVEGYYQVGSFRTDRAGLAGHVKLDNGLFTRVSLYGDLAQNDYDITIREPGVRGRLEEREVSLFHNRYRAAGGDVEVGVVDRSWAERLTLRAFAQRIDRELQSDLTLTTPYGEARTVAENRGFNLRWDHTFRRVLRVESIAGYAYVEHTLHDESRWVYDWSGERVDLRREPGEVAGLRFSRAGTRRHGAFARVLLTLRLTPAQRLQLSLTPTSWVLPGSTRDTGEAFLQTSLGAHMFTMVSGLSYLAEALGGRLSSTLFVKSYLRRFAITEPDASQAPLPADSRTVSRFGFGALTRAQLARPLLLTASYELATRLPSLTEVVGGDLAQAGTVANFSLRPEASHNFDLRLSFDRVTRSAGRFRFGTAAFARFIDRQIVLVSNPLGSFRQFQNVVGSNIAGAEGWAGWSERHDYLVLDANVTYAESAISTEARSALQGRVVNQPWFYANATARSFLRGLLKRGDELSLSYYLRHVRGHDAVLPFFNGLGTASPTSISTTHSLALTYLLPFEQRTLAASVEALNLSDERAPQLFFTREPGRSVFLKLGFSL